MVGLLDVARRTYTEVVDDIAGQLVCNFVYVVLSPHVSYLCVNLI